MEPHCACTLLALVDYRRVTSRVLKLAALCPVVPSSGPVAFWASDNCTAAGCFTVTVCCGNGATRLSDWGSVLVRSFVIPTFSSTEELKSLKMDLQHLQQLYWGYEEKLNDILGYFSVKIIRIQYLRSEYICAFLLASHTRFWRLQTADTVDTVFSAPLTGDAVSGYYYTTVWASCSGLLTISFTRFVSFSPFRQHYPLFFFLSSIFTFMFRSPPVFPSSSFSVLYFLFYSLARLTLRRRSSMFSQ